MNILEQPTPLVGQFESALGQALAGLTGIEFAVFGSLTEGAPRDELDRHVWEQTISIVDGPALWLVAGGDVWTSLAARTLEAAGLGDATEEDLRSTWQELVSQTMAGVADSLTAQTYREVTLSGGKEITSLPKDVSWAKFTIQEPNFGSLMVFAGWSERLASILAPPPDDPRPANGKDSKVSKTFDLLLDVALPVSVSFGRTSLQIREVLKLNTGSIVELNRLVSDPVDVVVNDCVIARGEVVVVDGNYGVRINQLASREDRLRSGMAQASAIAGAR